MSFLYVLIIKDKEEIKQQLYDRAKLRNCIDEKIQDEISCINDQDEFIKLEEDFKKDHHLLVCDCSKLSIEESITKVYNDIERYLQTLQHDAANTWTNQQVLFSKVAKKFNMQFYVNDGQPYLNNKRIILDIHKDTRHI